MNMFKAILYQIIHYGLFDKNSRGIFYPRSHYCKNGEPKVKYGHAETAEKAILSMKEKYGRKNMRAYKCGFCDGYHIGNCK